MLVWATDIVSMLSIKNLKQPFALLRKLASACGNEIKEGTNPVRNRGKYCIWHK